MKGTKTLPFANVARFHADLNGLVPNDAVLERKSVAVDFTASASDDGTTVIEAVFSTPIVDHDGDIVWSAGMSYDYYSGVVCWNHDLNQPPVGRVEGLSVTPALISGKIVLAKGYSRAEDLGQLARQGILRGISLGFIPKRVLISGTQQFAQFAAANSLNIEGCKRIIVAADLIEVSLCTVGANRQALIRSVATKSLKLDTDIGKAFGLDDEGIQLAVEAEARVVAVESEQEVTATETVVVEEVAPPTPPAPTPINWDTVKVKIITLPTQPDKNKVKTIAKALRAGRLI